MNELKYCPFCGSNNVHSAFYHFKDNGAKAVIECRNCYCSSGYYDNLKEAVAQWNTRIHAPELKPCPFCGGAVHLKFYKCDGDDTPKEDVLAHVECLNCHCSSISGSDFENVIDFWNSRF